MADGAVHHTVEWEGRKIGLIGLVEKEWLDTLATINPEEVDYTDYVEAAKALATELKQNGNNGPDSYESYTCAYIQVVSM